MSGTNGGVDRRLSHLEKVWQKNEERWQKSEERWQKSEERWQKMEQKSEERWQRNDQRLTKMIGIAIRQQKELDVLGKEVRRVGKRVDASLRALCRLLEGR